MALNKNAASSAASKFEQPEDDGYPGAGEGDDGEDDGGVEVVEQTQTVSKDDKLAEARRQAAAHAEKLKAAEEKPKATTTALAAAKPQAMVVSKISDLNPYTQLENVFPLAFNTFPQIKADQGSFKLADGDKNMGDTLTVELISWQYQWQLSPGDMDDPKGKEYLRYSADGVTAENGDDMQEILALAKSNGFPKAKISKRALAAVRVIDGGKAAKQTNDKFHIIDLSSSSLQNFQRYQLEVSYAASKGRTAEGFQPEVVKIHAKAVKRNNLSWTEVQFGGVDADFED